MLLSIIIPVFNVAEYLERCLNSVINRNTNDVEIILIDDGSTDYSPEICDRYAKSYKNIRVIHQENCGLASARNMGIENSSGEYLAFLDSDDMYEDSFIEDMIGFINEYNPDMISFSCCFEKKSNKFKINGSKNVHESSYLEYYDLILRNKMGSQICFHVYKKKLFNNNLFTVGCYYEDIRLFWKLISGAVKIIDVDFSYYIYNITNHDSITKSFNIKSMEDMKLSIDIMINGIVDVLETVSKMNDELFRKAENARLNGYIYILYKLMKSSEKSKVKNDLIKYINNSHVNLWKYKEYDCKKYLLCKLLVKIRKDSL